MKKIFKIALVLAIGVLGMSCTKENNPNEEESGVYIFTAKAVDIAGAGATKTYLGTDGLQARWTGNEVLHLAYVQNGEAKTVDVALDPACQDKTDAVFTLKAEDATALAGVETVYPYITSNLETTFPNMYEGKLYLKTIYWKNDGTVFQRPTAGNYDPDRDVLVSEPIPVGSLNNGERIALNLTRPVTLLKLVPIFEPAAKELIKDTKITYVDVGVWGGGHLSGQRGYDWSDQNYHFFHNSNDFFAMYNVSSGQFENSDWNVSWDEPIYLFCFPVPNDEISEFSEIEFSLKFSNGFVFSSWDSKDESSKIFIKAKHPDFHLDAGKIHTITFTVTADRMVKK